MKLSAIVVSLLLASGCAPTVDTKLDDRISDIAAQEAFGEVAAEICHEHIGDTLAKYRDTYRLEKWQYLRYKAPLVFVGLWYTATIGDESDEFAIACIINVETGKYSFASDFKRALSFHTSTSV